MLGKGARRKRRLFKVARKVVHRSGTRPAARRLPDKASTGVLHSAGTRWIPRRASNRGCPTGIERGWEHLCHRCAPRARANTRTQLKESVEVSREGRQGRKEKLPIPRRGLPMHSPAGWKGTRALFFCAPSRSLREPTAVVPARPDVFRCDPQAHPGPSALHRERPTAEWRH